MKILIVSVHPDDETLGCGGTILKHRDNGDELYWLIATQTYEPQWTKESIEQRAQEVDKISNLYGIKEYFKLGFASTQLDTIAKYQLIDKVREVVEKVQPEVVYLVNRSDIHTDHQVIFDAVIVVLKPFVTRFNTKRILCYETLSSTEAAPPLLERFFVPNIYSDISEYMEEKLEIMSVYQSEIQLYPLPRSLETIKALAKFRGATIGVEYAEAFMLIREIF